MHFALGLNQRGKNLHVQYGPHHTHLVRGISCKCDHLLAVPFLIAVIHIFLAADFGGCCFEEPLIWELEYGDFAVKYK